MGLLSSNSVENESKHDYSLYEYYEDTTHFKNPDQNENDNFTRSKRVKEFLILKDKH